MTGPLITVVRGEPDDEELAALTVALLSLTAARARPVRPVPPAPAWTRDAFTAPGAWSRPF